MISVLNLYLYVFKSVYKSVLELNFLEPEGWCSISCYNQGILWKDTPPPPLKFSVCVHQDPRASHQCHAQVGWRRQDWESFIKRKLLNLFDDKVQFLWQRGIERGLILIWWERNQIEKKNCMDFFFFGWVFFVLTLKLHIVLHWV